VSKKLTIKRLPVSVTWYRCMSSTVSMYEECDSIFNLFVKRSCHDAVKTCDIQCIYVYIYESKLTSKDHTIITIYYLLESDFLQEKFEGIKLIIRSLIRSRTYITKKKKTKRQTMSYKTLHRNKNPLNAFNCHLFLLIFVLCLVSVGEVHSIQHNVIKFCQWLAAGRWFTLGIPVSYTNKTSLHEISDKLLKVDELQNTAQKQEPTKQQWWTEVLRNGQYFQLRWWYRSAHKSINLHLFTISTLLLIVIYFCLSSFCVLCPLARCTRYSIMW
jgi:hypothetical protein